MWKKYSHYGEIVWDKVEIQPFHAQALVSGLTKAQCVRKPLANKLKNLKKARDHLLLPEPSRISFAIAAIR